MQIFFRLWKQLSELNFKFISLLSLLIILFGTFSVYFIEPETFPTLFDSFWWTMTTLTTVGYGDFFPVTVAGRLVGIFLFIFGIGLIGVLIGKIVEGASTYQRLKKEGKLVYKKNGHYVYIGWSKKTEQAIHEVLYHNSKAPIVLIEDLPETPITHDGVHFISGDPSEERTLLKANILEAKRVAIFSDPRIDNPVLCDGKSLLVASAVEALSVTHNVDIQTVVEISEERHISKFNHIRVDDFILSDDSVSLLMAKATLQPGTTSIFRQLLSKRFGNNIYVIKAKSSWNTYRDASQKLLDDGAVLIAVNEDMDFRDANKKKLNEGDLLYIICEDSTFKKLNVLYETID
ncbi:TrkA family potassium uptake protein [Jeotgalibacillus sp. R-1-5s-1]|uniref:potassium channel family protein n=1 Tax=Jeotgalibacillus sp. R-1-5s-1 TaxID=2555897 RepID=UPI00106D7B62|nr:potassium channel protein [Jeotgalibacillus sp. R-1-5s-1]TFD96591.1 potassium channel protein [Jeotgalibacillus sp. R-1-5s-1]